MANSNSYCEPHFPLPEAKPPIQQKPIASSKSYTHFFCKSLLVIAFLIALPLFPSQAPEFINLTILTKFWDLLYLLFVGIAVCYGLFSQRNVEVGIETHSNIDNSLSNMSKMFHVSSFEDNFENPCGSDERKRIHTWNSLVVANGSSVLDEQSKPRSMISEDGFEMPSGFDEKVIQSWNSKYFQNESMVVVANESYVFDEWDSPEPSITSKPLGLPVRSLRSTISDPDNAQSVNGSGSGSGLKGFSKSCDRYRYRKFGDLGSLDLEEKFKETAALPSPIPWHSRSGSTEMREEFGTVTHISHSMPLSAEEYQYEQLKAPSFRSTRSFSSQTSSVSSSPNKLSPSSSVSSELSNSTMEELGRQKSLCGSSSAVSPLSSTPINSKAPLNRPNSRRFSVGSSFEINVRSSFRDEMKDFSRSKREDPSVRKEWGLGSLKADVKPETRVKASLRGKSVRTIRAGEHTAEIKKVRDISGNRIDDKVGKTFNEVEAVLMGRTEMRAGEHTAEVKKVRDIRGNRIDVKVGKTFNEVEAALMGRTGMRAGGLKNLSVENKKLNLDTPCAMPNPAFFNSQKGEKQEFGENSIAESKEDSEGEDDSFQVSSDEEESSSNTVNDAGTDTNEVDKKAGEFIAKFKEQIRLQKINSMKRSSGLWATHW